MLRQQGGSRLHGDWCSDNREDHFQLETCSAIGRLLDRKACAPTTGRLAPPWRLSMHRLIRRHRPTSVTINHQRTASVFDRQLDPIVAPSLILILIPRLDPIVERLKVDLLDLIACCLLVFVQRFVCCLQLISQITTTNKQHDRVA